MSERKLDDLPHVQPFSETVDTVYMSEGHVKYGMPGAKRTLAQAIAGLMSYDADPNQNTPEIQKISTDVATKITAVRIAASLINKNNPGQITKNQLRDMVTTIIMEGSPAIPSVNFFTRPENKMPVSSKEITQTIETGRQAQLNQSKKTDNKITELDTKQ